MADSGFVAMLDVLGFSSLISGDDPRLNRYLDALQEVIGDPGASNVHYVVFSDSIVLTTGKDAGSMQSLIQRCSHLLGVMLDREIALRGAIAYGDYTRKESSAGVFVAGKAIIDAYNFERQQDWVGIMLTPSAVRQKPDLEELCRIGPSDTKEMMLEFRERFNWASFLQNCHSIPFHTENILGEPNYFNGFAIVPSVGVAEPAALSNSLEKSLHRINWLKSIAPNPPAQRKYQETYNWLNQILGRWRDVTFRFRQAGLAQ